MVCDDDSRGGGKREEKERQKKGERKREETSINRTHLYSSSIFSSLSLLYYLSFDQDYHYSHRYYCSLD